MKENITMLIRYGVSHFPAILALHNKVADA
jgi:hypothetical protein